MSEKKWIGFTDSSEVDEAPKIEIDRKSKRLVTRDMRDSGHRTTLTVRYTTSGAWEGTVNEFQQIEIPETTTIEKEGAPAVPKDGIFIAVPTDAENINVRVADKSYIPVDQELVIAPAPKQFIEEEFQEVYEPDPTIYGSDEPYPGCDFEFLGLKTISGVSVVHIMVYLGQYRPRSKRLKLIQSMVLEVSYMTPPATDRHPGRKPREMPEDDLIIGLELLDNQTDYSSRVEDFNELDQQIVEELEDDSDPYSLKRRGITFLEQLEDEVSDPNMVPISPTGLVSVISMPPTELRRLKLKISGLIAEYVIVTTKALESAVGPLLSAKTGWPYYANVALTEDIQVEFPGVSLKDSIKAFIKWATINWRVPPRFIVLAGDSNVIPMHMYNRGGKTYASDHFYADISGDLVPELTVSRIPTSNATQLKSICKHLVRYGKYRRGDWGGWQNRVMLSAYQSSTYETTCDTIYNKISHATPL